MVLGRAGGLLQGGCHGKPLDHSSSRFLSIPKSPQDSAFSSVQEFLTSHYFPPPGSPFSSISWRWIPA